MGFLWSHVWQNETERNVIREGKLQLYLNLSKLSTNSSAFLCSGYKVASAVFRATWRFDVPGIVLTAEALQAIHRAAGRWRRNSGPLFSWNKSSIFITPTDTHTHSSTDMLLRSKYVLFCKLNFSRVYQKKKKKRPSSLLSVPSIAFSSLRSPYAAEGKNEIN